MFWIPDRNNSRFSRPNVPLLGFGNGGGPIPPQPPANAIRARNGAYILTRDGKYILARPTA